MRINAQDLVKELPALVPFKRAADFLSMSTRALRSYITTGRIRAFKMNPHRAGKVLIPRSEIARLLEEAAVRSFREFLPSEDEARR